MSVLKDGDEAGKDQRGKKMAGRGGGGKGRKLLIAENSIHDFV